MEGYSPKKDQVLVVGKAVEADFNGPKILFLESVSGSDSQQWYTVKNLLPKMVMQYLHVKQQVFLAYP